MSLYAYPHSASKKCAICKNYLYLVTGYYRLLVKDLAPVGGRRGGGLGVNAQRPPLGKAAGVAENKVGGDRLSHR